MALIRVDGMFKIYGAKVVHKQAVKIKPIEHHYENEGEEPYIKYSCPICEKLSIEYNKIYSHSNGLFDENERFINFSFSEGTEQCPCCGININWDYKKFDFGKENKQEIILEKGVLRLWKHYSSCEDKTWFTIHECDECNSLEEISFAYKDEISLVKEVINRGNKVTFTDNATFEDYMAQFKEYEKGSEPKNPIYPYCNFETYAKALEIWNLLNIEGVWTRLNLDISIEKETELIKKLYLYMGIGYNEENIEHDIKHDYLTCNKGRDGKYYFWYLDENKSMAIDMDGNIIDNETLFC